MREAIANFGDARQSFVAFVETGWEHAELGEVPRLLDEVAGALRMLEQQLPADYLVAVKRYVEVELLARKRVPNSQQLDTMADALASLEYYLEALRDQRPARDEILEIARHALERLRYWPRAGECRGSGCRRCGRDCRRIGTVAGLADALDFGTIEPFRGGVTHPSPSAAGAAPRAGRRDARHQPTPRLLVPRARRHQRRRRSRRRLRAQRRHRRRDPRGLPRGTAGRNRQPRRTAARRGPRSPDDAERLRPIRRVFHTLKGSGRLVGAKTLGEFSWKVENMLNRVLDGTRLASPAVVALVGHAYDTLPQLHAALRGEAAITADLTGIEAVADRLAAGEEAIFTPAAAAAPSIEPVVEIVPELADAAIVSIDMGRLWNPATNDAALDEPAPSRRPAAAVVAAFPPRSMRCCWKSSPAKSAATS